MKTQPYEDYVVRTQADFESLLDTLGQEEVVSVDTETNWTDLFASRYCMGISLYLPNSKSGYYIPIAQGDKDNIASGVELSLLSSVLSKRTCVFHNAKFDVSVLERCGVRITGPYHDTMLIHYLLNENEDQGLKPLAVKYVDPEADNEKGYVKKLQGAFGWEGIPTPIMANYAIKDTYLTQELFEMFYPGIERSKLESVLQREYLFSDCLRGVEAIGIKVSPEEAAEQSRRCTIRMKEIIAELGFDPAKRNTLLEKLFGTPPIGLGLRPVAYGKPSKAFPMGAPSTGVAELSEYSHPIVALILEYRKLQKAQSTWYDGWRELMDENFRIHATYRQEGTVTGRLSCANPNMQQVPRDTINNPVKKLLRAEVGYELWEFDYSQVELRLATVYASEARMLEVFKSGGDPHTAVAIALGVDRQIGKTINFLVLYGGGVKKLFEVLCTMKGHNYTWDDAEKFMADFHEKFPGFKQIKWKTTKASEKRGWIQYWTGRRRRMPADEHHNAFNSLIQGGAAEIMKDTMLKFHFGAVPEVKMVATIHDALWFEVPVGRPELLAQIQHTMEHWVEEDFQLPFPVDRKRLA